MRSVKTVSIKYLHEATGLCVREAASQTLIVTDRGRRVALLKPYDEAELPRRAFPKRDAGKLPDVGVDSTTLISQDRDER